MNLSSHYVPVFSSIVESSLWDEPDYVVKVFITMLALKEKDHVVRKHVGWLATCARKTEEEVLKAIKVLESPDKRRPGQEHDGRRIKRVADGWLILNGEKYQEEMALANRRARQAKYRDKIKNGTPLKGEQEYVAAERAGASEESLNAIVNKNLPRTAQ